MIGHAFKCAFCGREFRTKAGRAIHESIHIRPESPFGDSDTCGHRTPKRADLEWHDQHDGEERA